MPEMPDVVTNETIESEWGNNIRDRTVQRYTDLTDRAADHPTPAAGDLSYVASTGDLDVYHSGAWRHIGVPVGTILDHGGGSIPVGYLACDGSAVSRTTYAGLFAQIGTTWGAGDGSTTFNVPDLRGRHTRGVATSRTGDAVGETFGADTHNHSVNPASFDSSIAVQGASQSANVRGLVASGDFGGGGVSLGNTGRHTHDVDVPSTNTSTLSTHPVATAAVNKIIKT